MGRWIETQRGIVAPGDCDVNRHMNVRGYFERFDNASGYLLKQAGLYYGEVAATGRGVGTVVNTIRYHRELVDGDPYVIESAFVRLGRSSFRYVHRMIDGKRGALSASSDLTEVLFSLDSRASVPLDGDMRARIATMLVTLSGEEERRFGPAPPAPPPPRRDPP